MLRGDHASQGGSRVVHSAIPLRFLFFGRCYVNEFNFTKKDFTTGKYTLFDLFLPYTL